MKISGASILNGRGLLKIADGIEVTYVLTTWRSMSIRFGGASSANLDSPNTSLAQRQAILNEIQEFKKKDSLSKPCTANRQENLT